MANPEDQEHRVNRRFYLEKLSEYVRYGKNVALVGPKKSGKSSLAKQIVTNLRLGQDILPVYIGLNRTSTPPENFSIELMGNVCFWSSGAFSNSSNQTLSSFYKFQTIEYLISIKDKLGKNAADIIDIVNNELQKIKPDQKLILQKAFSFAEEISKKIGKKIVFVIDDFENIFDLNNFGQIKDVLSLMDFKSKNVHYIVTSSAKTQLLSGLKNNGNFVIEEILGFTYEETEKLVEKTIGKIDKKIVEQIHSYSNGLPVLIRSISLRYLEVKDIKKAFLIEMTFKNSNSYLYLDSILKDFLYRARGEAMPKTVVKVMTFMQSPRLTEISKKIYRSAPVTKSLLERMMQVDLIVKVDNKYNFSNPILKQWLKLVFLGVEFDYVPSDRELKQIEEVLDEKQ